MTWRRANGPLLVPAVHAGDPGDLRIELRHNGRVMQDETTADMLFDVAAIVSHVSCVAEIGMMPLRLTAPTVGLMPTSPETPDGHTIEPSVSVPTPMAARLAAIAVPVPELEPHGLRSRT